MAKPVSDLSPAAIRPAIAVRLILVTLLVVAFDQMTKIIARASIAPGQRIPVIDGFFDLTLTFNPGVAFGLFAGISNDFVRLP